MVNATADDPNETYDEQAIPAVDTDNSDGHTINGNPSNELSFRLEIVRVSGREGEKLQAIQARAIREALLWAAQRKDSTNNLREDESDGRNE